MSKAKKNGNGIAKLKYHDSSGRPTSAFIEAVKAFPVVQGDDNLARDICQICKIENYKIGDFISRQGEDDDFAFFILSGRVDVRVNENSVAIREVKELVGEMAVMSFATKRCASLVAVEDVVALKIKAEDFSRLTDAYPKMVKRMFNALADRLRERNEQFRCPNSPPIVFVGSSTGGKEFSHKFVDKVKSIIDKTSVRKSRCKDIDNESHEVVNTIKINYWDKDVFSLSGMTLSTLIEESKRVDFAIFVLTKDDLTIRENRYSQWCPRDNVVFEAGLFMGALSRDRVIIVMNENDFKKLKLPTDWQGFTLAVFKSDNTESFNNKAKELANKIQMLGSLGGFKK